MLVAAGVKHPRSREPHAITDPTLLHSLLVGEIAGLEPFDFVAVRPAGKPLHLVEVTRDEGGKLLVRVPGRPPLVPPLEPRVRSALRERGFASENPEDPTQPWSCDVPDDEAAMSLVQRVLLEVFEEKPDATLDVMHGSHRAEYEMRKKLEEIRARIEKLLTEMEGHPPAQDEDGDYVLPIDDVHVVVAPRAAPGTPSLVRVFAITNVGVAISPELGLFLSNLNFALMFGRFALDAANRSIWFDQTLLGDHFSDEELRFAIEMVSSTADHWDDRLKQMFGGSTWQEVLKTRPSESSTPRLKPGEGGYL